MRNLEFYVDEGMNELINTRKIGTYERLVKLWCDYCESLGDAKLKLLDLYKTEDLQYISSMGIEFMCEASSIYKDGFRYIFIERNDDDGTFSFNLKPAAYDDIIDIIKEHDIDIVTQILNFPKRFDDYIYNCFAQRILKDFDIALLC